MMDRNEMPLTEMRILIVDDDATMRLQLGRMILAIGDGFRLAGEARDGRSALEFCRTNPVDIVITDMKMPGMDGNALIQALQHLKEPPAIIALSAYEDFPLVRTALRSGAADYMLKLSLTSQDLLRVLEEIRQSLLDFDRAASHPEKKDELEQVLYELAHFRSGDRDEMRRRLAEAGFSFHAGTWYGLFLRIHETYRLEEIEQEEYAMLQFSLLSLIREELGKSEESYVFPGRTGEFYGFLRTGRREDLEIISRRLISTILLYHDLHATAGLSEGAGEVGALADLAEQARSAIRERFYCTGSVFWYQNTVRKLPDRRETAGEFRAEMKLAVDALIFEDVQKVQESIDRLMVLIMKEQPEKETLLQNCMYFDYELHKYMEKYELPIEEVLRRSRKTPQQFLAMENVQEIQLWLQDLKKDLTSYVRRTTVTDREKLVSRIDDYIARHYAEEEMGIQMMAEKMGFSCGYFGALVKKLTGETFSRRLTRYRMEKAKQLLTGSDLRIQEVGASVGIPDQFYFSRVFKRVVGESPVEYRSAAAGTGNRP